MKVSMVLNPNCSEAVFRFWTADPEQIRQIVQAFADETSPGFTVPKLQKAEDVGRVEFPACNHDGECFFESELGAFILRVGNNDLQGEACEFVESLGIVVEEAETSPDLSEQYARDCTCGIKHFNGYENRKITISVNPVVRLPPKRSP
jgi:hypothetical protein